MHPLLFTLALSDADRIAGALITISALWLLCAALTALFAQTRTYPFFPIFVCCLFIPFPLVLLVVTIAGQTHVNAQQRAEGGGAWPQVP